MKWIERLERAIKLKGFTEEDEKLASLWVTCPISEVANRIKLVDDKLEKGPVDIYLLIDGIYFTKAVEDNDINLAVACYKSIAKQVEEIEKGTDRIQMLKCFK